VGETGVPADGPGTRAATDDLDRIVDDLAESYAKYRVAVIGLIFARPSERITLFADAFRIRKRH
jgi:hypothetical protein